jgi:hypothetical protein
MVRKTEKRDSLRTLQFLRDPLRMNSVKEGAAGIVGEQSL